MLSALVNRTKALVGFNDTQSQLIFQKTDLESPNQEMLINQERSFWDNHDENSAVLQGNVFDCIRTIRDPEKPATLEDLDVVYESGVKVIGSVSGNRAYIVDIEFNPTVPHCSLATLIGLCMRIKVERCLTDKIKLDIHIKPGAHDTEEEINKQINDKERVAAAMENPSLREMVENCIKEEDS